MKSVSLIMNAGDAYVQDPVIASIVLVGVQRLGTGQKYSPVAPASGSREYFHDWPIGKIQFGSTAPYDEDILVMYKD